MHQAALLHTPPAFCQYASGPCDQDFSEIVPHRGLFLYSSKPAPIAATIETAASQLDQESQETWKTWRDIDISGRVIFCEICKAIRGAATVYADVTTLNFNLLFEMGFCLGLDVPVRPIRDTTYLTDRRDFDALGVLDTLGYIDFTNADNLASKARDHAGPTLGRVPEKTYRDTPLYVLKGPIDTEGTVQLLSTLKKSPLNYRTHDPRETRRVSLYDHWKQVRGSYGIVANLLSPERQGARVHNALCAFLCGIAMAEQKVVVMLQEEAVAQPIDYRDVVQPWEDPSRIPQLLERPITEVIESLQEAAADTAPAPSGILDRVDLGDPAAENEIGGLRSYFVPTGQFAQATHGHARLVVGRKGAGKTAFFYGVRTAVRRGRQVLVLDMRPEGHQFTRLREAVLEHLSSGQQEYTISAFWTYLLSAEIAHKILNNQREYQAAQRDPERFARYEALQAAYLAHGLASGDDLSQRLLRQVDRLAEHFGEVGLVTGRTDLAELVYGGDIRTLNDAVADYLTAEKEEVWFLIDNLDKSWATRGATPEDVLIVRGLLEATRKLERQLDKRGVTLKCLVFIRTDVLEHLQQGTPDRGKESAIRIDWDDVELFREVMRRRIAASTGLEGNFESVWGEIAVPLVGAEDSFGYLVDRTLMRPRDLLMFAQRAVEVAVNRGHGRISSEDILQAESGYSEDALLWLSYEIDDTHPGVSDALYAFHGGPTRLTELEVRDRLLAGGLEAGEAAAAIELLLWFGFLGVELSSSEELYAYAVRFNLRRLTHPVETGGARYVVHPAFRKALAVSG